MKEISISIYGSHDSSVSVIFNNKDVKIFELERFTKNRYAAICKSLENHIELGKIGTPTNLIIDFYNYINSYIINKGYAVNKIYYLNLFDEDIEIIKSIFTNCDNFVKYSHHDAHCRGSLYQSPFEKALVISFDGGGVNYDGVGYTHIFIDEKGLQSPPNRIDKLNIDFGGPYSWFAKFIKYIKKDPTLSEDLPKLNYAGKIMGLVAYGTVRNEWIDKIENYYKTSIGDGFLGDKLGFEYDSMENQEAFDLAATSQYVFEKLALEKFLPYIEKYPDLPIILTGGCALNVLFNQKLKDLTKKDIFVSCNPNDCGLSFGGLLLNENYGDEMIDVTYSGFDIIDESNIDYYRQNFKNKEVTLNEIVSILKKEKIIGVINGSSECGPRALGNRSIICYPVFPNMKDTINKKVKFREWFRPFAPVCKLEEVNKYFEFDSESKFMSFAPKIKQEYSEKLISIAHHDNTARVQTVTREQHEFFYDLLSCMEKNEMHGVLLNTSFNIKGHPILTTIEDALNVLNSTELDYVLYKNTLFYK